MSHSSLGGIDSNRDKQNESWIKKKKKAEQQQAYFTPKLLLSPELMHNNVWPFPSKPHPASLGSGLMGNHGYRPHTSPPFFYSRERDWRVRERRRRMVYCYLNILVSLMSIGSLCLHKAVHYHVRTGLPIPLQHTAQLERNKLGSAIADRLAASGQLFVPPQCQTLKSLLYLTQPQHPRNLLSLL